MSISRRVAIQTLAAAGATAVLPREVYGRSRVEPTEDAVGMLYDPTCCIGCLDCVRGCAVANECDEELATQADAQLTPLSLTVLRCFEENGTATFHKEQCMHCVDPACVSACMLGAMQKNADGTVTWNGDLCVGCRYCQIGCPFNKLRFEWDTPFPRLMKCELCPERRAQGLEPACAEKCKRGALTYGRRRDLLVEAHARIAAHPDRYQPKVYGEHDGGGTSVLYLGRPDVTFASLGLPELGTTSVPHLPEKIQHTLYKWMAAPAVLLGVLATVVRRNYRLQHAAEHADPAPDGDRGRGHGHGPDHEHDHDHDHERSAPVGGKLWTPPFAVLTILALIGVAAVGWRFLVGLGATTNLSDGYPMGIWIAFDVVTGTALACGGYAVALLVYVLNRGKYHPLVRAALVTSALGYTLGGLSVLVDLGRFWNFWKIIAFPWTWNFNSILLEVALCIMLYTAVLWIEVSPAFFERWQGSRSTWLRRLALAVAPRLERALPFAIALGLLLPTMHQSSLGSLMLLAGAKLHPLWSTPLLPLLFLVSCVTMGYAAVTLESTISSRVFRRPSETPMLRELAGPISLVLFAYVGIRMLDVVLRGQLGPVLELDRYGVLFLVEMSLFALPACGLAVWRRYASVAFLVTAATMVILAGGLYRFSTFLIAFNPGPEWSYFPSLIELAVTIGLVAAEVLGYIVLVKRFPILRGAPGDFEPAGAGAEPPAAARIEAGAPA
jgi:Ni/Fe-hydrogenase subunit HybB-like protein/Fe-S-cluster-containing dehydrogenase component